MNKLTAVKPTKQDDQIIKAAVDAVRSVQDRFIAANKGTVCYAPHVTINLKGEDVFFTLTMSGTVCTSPAVGHTLGEAMESLCSNPDAGFLRRRANTLMQKARELEHEADVLEGVVSQPVPTMCDPAEPSVCGYTAPACSNTAGTEGGAE